LGNVFCYLNFDPQKLVSSTYSKSEIRCLEARDMVKKTYGI